VTFNMSASAGTVSASVKARARILYRDAAAAEKGKQSK
jgi:hypothetical protein